MKKTKLHHVQSQGGANDNSEALDQGGVTSSSYICRVTRAKINLKTIIVRSTKKTFQHDCEIEPRRGAATLFKHLRY